MFFSKRITRNALIQLLENPYDTERLKPYKISTNAVVIFRTLCEAIERKNESNCRIYEEKRDPEFYTIPDQQRQAIKAIRQTKESLLSDYKNFLNGELQAVDAEFFLNKVKAEMPQIKWEVKKIKKKVEMSLYTKDGINLRLSNQRTRQEIANSPFIYLKMMFDRYEKHAEGREFIQYIKARL